MLKKRNDALSIVSCLNGFVSLNEHRLEIFSKFWNEAFMHLLYLSVHWSVSSIRNSSHAYSVPIHMYS